MLHNLLIKPNKIILLSPSGIMDKLLFLDKNNIDIQILIMFGEKEGIFGITMDHYKKYSSFELDKCKIFIHSQGHVIPSKSTDKKIIKDFLEI